MKLPTVFGLLALGLATCACSPSLPPGDGVPTEEMQSIIDMVVEVFAEHPLLQDPNDSFICQDYRMRLKMWVTDVESLACLCGGDKPVCEKLPPFGPPCIAGCNIIYEGQPLVAVVEVPGLRTHGTIIHETLHWLSECTLASNDGGHSNPYLWLLADSTGVTQPFKVEPEAIRRYDEILRERGE